MIKVNPVILNDPIRLEQVRAEIIFLTNQIPSNWNGHMKLEYLKVILRSTIGKFTGIIRKDLEEEISSLEESLNDIVHLKQKVVLKGKNPDESDEKFNHRTENIRIASTKIANELDNTRKKLESQKAFKATANWYEYGERSNKFFLNLNKFRNKQKLISYIKNDDIEYKGQSEVMAGITNFYSKLYSKVRTPATNDETFFNLCPKLSEQNKAKLDDKISLEEMFQALKSCGETAPGPDGIPYSVYKHLWKETGFILKEAWDYSLEVGELPKSHKESAIVIIPKEGKNTADIKNWRPITLSNCDAKIITKALALRLNPVLNSIIDPCQTAYVPGRSVMDNLRCNKFLKDYCRKNNINAVLASLDARKAFDSVDHEYIDEILSRYGFGDSFRLYFKTLYKDISARIIINGYFSDQIGIERGVKQGDALSCAIFILCIDPLLRNLNHNSKIKSVQTNSGQKNKIVISHKASGFADDVSVVCMDDGISLSQVFAEYQRLTDKSGLTLNAEKTEILSLSPDVVGRKFAVIYENQKIVINSVLKLKICGLFFCKDTNEEYNLNVVSKINNLINKLKIWKSRHLTFEGKSLILKTFGISQLIYNMQCTRFESVQLKEIERYIFNFLWNTNDIEIPRARDRIKRSIMKNDYEKGGLKITDIESLDRSLKLRQYIRASISDHSIKQVQKFCTNNGTKNEVLLQEFKIVSTEEDICGVAQESLNIITDYCRKDNFSERGEFIESRLAIEQIAMTDVNTYLTRKSRVFLKCMFRPLQKNGIVSFLDLVREAEIEMDREASKRFESIIKAFPPYYRDCANSFDDNINTENSSLTHILNVEGRWVPINEITTKELQKTFKLILNKISDANFTVKLGIQNTDTINIINFRKGCKNPRLRHIHFRLIHDDFFTYSKMFKYNMTVSPHCPRCGMEETTRHLLWECFESKNIWTIYNVILSDNGNNSYLILEYEDIYRTESNTIASLIKMKIIQEMIQIDRPKRWNKEILVQIILRMKELEIATVKSHRKDEMCNKWNKFMMSLSDREFPRTT
jgi:hypothetical protein